MIPNLTLSSLSKAIGECKGMNTYKDSKYICRCLPGFPFGDPISKQGCYKCETKCHPHGYCSYPGVCKCSRGLVGDGVNFCDVPVPMVTGVYPSTVRPQGLIESHVTYYIEESYIPTLFFCKFGNETVAGSLIEPGFGKCTIPPSTEHAVRVSLSFDGENYSTSDVFIRYNQSKNNGISINWIPVVATLMVFSWCNLIITHWSKGTEEDKIDQNKVNNNRIHAFDAARDV